LFIFKRSLLFLDLFSQLIWQQDSYQFSFFSFVKLPYLISRLLILFQVSSTTAAESQSSQVGKSESKDKDDAAASPTDDFTMRTTPEPPHLSETESRLYYYGLPSEVRLIARTGSTPWEEPTGPETSWRAKKVGPASSHPISDVWDFLSPNMLGILLKAQVDWVSIGLATRTKIQIRRLSGLESALVPRYLTKSTTTQPSNVNNF